jgi:glutamine---fructose-6-phosphate transaminase (isomerizing)
LYNLVNYKEPEGGFIIFMCGIVGYIGKTNAVKPVVDGLAALEYRGYDSAGVAYITNDNPHLVKQVGRVEALRSALAEAVNVDQASVAIGHTRWATHGSPTTANAHPHSNTDGTIFAVHNGIIENYAELRTDLQKDGYVFASETDTEVIPHLIDHYYRKTQNLDQAFEIALKELRGAYAIVACSSLQPNTIYAAKLSSPLALGVGKDELFLASDPTAIMDKTKEVVFIDDYEMVILRDNKYTIKNFKTDEAVSKVAEKLDYDVDAVPLGEFPDYTLKEIFEAPQTIRSATLGRTNAETRTIKLGGLETVADQLRYIDRIVIVACGTASYAGMLGEYLFEEIAGIPVEVHLGSEFKYRSEPFSRGTVVIAVSQSGETADTLAALEKVSKYGVLRLGVVNAVGSAVARNTDAGVYCHAGPEKAVASTKAFIAQVMVLLQMALYLGQDRSPLFTDLIKDIDSLPQKAEAVLAQADKIKAIADKYRDYKDFMFIGRRYGYPMALEGALKLKEMTLIHAEGYAAGEMKHGPLAMIDEDFPTFAMATNNPMYEKTCSNIEEIKARKGKVVAVATEGNTDIERLADDVIYIPDSMEQTQPILVAIAMQLFAYYIAVGKGLEVDRPRNLAKSVTVE